MLLSQPTLVLNSHWVAIDVTTVRHALVLAYGGAARILEMPNYSLHDFEAWVGRDSNAGHYVQTISLRIEVPEVVVLNRYGGFPHRTAAFTRRNLYRRDDYSCQYCGARPGASELTIDHVLPRSRSGPTSWENCVLACKSCNKRKGNKTPTEIGFQLRHPPMKPNWSPSLILGPIRTRDSWKPFVSETRSDAMLA